MKIVNECGTHGGIGFVPKIAYMPGRIIQLVKQTQQNLPGCINPRGKIFSYLLLRFCK